MNQWRSWVSAGLLSIWICASAIGCKKESNPPPPETDPEKLRKVEQQVQDAAKQEGKAQQQ